MSGREARGYAAALPHIRAAIRAYADVTSAGAPSGGSMTLPIVEMVARAMAQASGRDPEGITAPARGQMGSRRLWELYLPQATAALEASHHAELVEALRKAAPFIGWAMSRGCGMLAGSQPEPLCDQMDALLANVGCRHSLIVSGERMVCTKCDYSTDFASSAAKIEGDA